MIAGREQEIIDMYLSGVTVPNICIHLCGERRNWEAVYKLLKQRGIYRFRHKVTYHRKYNVKTTYFETIDTEAKAYLLGFFTADGYTDEIRKALRICLNAIDVELLHWISNELSDGEIPIRQFVKDGKYHHASIEICSAELVQQMVAKGVRQGKSLTLTSEVFSHVPDDLKRHFLRGYFDGDGCMTLGAKYSSGVKYLIQIVGTEDFLRNTFCKEFPTNCKLHKYKSCEMWCYKISKKSEVLRFLDYIYADSTCNLKRKHDMYRAHVKPCELTGSPNERDEGNQQPSLLIEEGSTTIENTPLGGS